MDYVIVNPDDVHVHVCACGQMATTRFMTGQEWYDRFLEEQGKLQEAQSPFGKTTDMGVAMAIRQAQEAAERAAGLGGSE